MAQDSDSVTTLLASLGIAPDRLASRSLVLHPEAVELHAAETDADGRQHLLILEAAKGWSAMKQSAAADGVAIRIVSAFRSIERQAEIVQRKLRSGLSLDAILSVSAPPGYSEHHSGRAVDIATDGARPLEEEFEGTGAFRWLSANAGRFGYSLSFPRGNRFGYAYEPWHWYFSNPPSIA